MKKIAIFGAGGLGKEIVWLIERINKLKPTWDIYGFIENKSTNEQCGNNIYGYKVFDEETWLANYKEEIYVICSIGEGLKRKYIYEKVSECKNIKIATLIDPSVIIDNSVEIGEGSVICKNCSITVDTEIGKGVLLNINSLIGHDSKIGDYCTFSPHAIASGRTIVGKFCSIGAGAFLLEGINIVANTTVGPLSGIYKNIKSSGTYSGNPARQIR